LNELDRLQQLQSLMMGYDHSSLNYQKEHKIWILALIEGKKETVIVNNKLDNLIKILLNSDL